MATTATTTTPPPVGGHPLAPCQETLWLLHQVGEVGSAYSLPFGVHLRGQLDVGALQAACQVVVDRHPPLRSVVEAEGGAAWLVPRPEHARVSFRRHDLGGMDDADREAAAAEVFRACVEPFDLERGPLVRFDLVQAADDRWTLWIVPHHIVFDGLSKAIFVDEMTRSYRALVLGRAPELPPPSGAYADYAVEERERVADLLGQLRADPASLASIPIHPQVLPFDRARPSELAGAGGWVELTLEQPLRSRLGELARECDATMFQMVSCGLLALLYRYGNHQRVGLTATMGTRTPGTEDVIGFFVNNVPFGADVDDDPSFVQLLTRVRDAARQASRRRRVPLAGLVELLNPPRHPGLNPLFQVGLGYQNEVVDPAELPDLEADWQMLAPNFGAKCDLLLQALDRRTSLDARFEYSVELFDAPTVERLAGHFRALLAGAAEDPNRKLSALPLLADDERRQLLVGWNRTELDAPTDRCAHELFEAQAARTPDAPAVVLGDELLTYAELDGRADRLAQHLRSLGIVPEALVGICLERCTDLVVALLATWKAGGAYVPLDPGYPHERLALMLDDARPAVLVTQEHLRERLPDHPRVVLLDRDQEAIDACSPDRLTTERPSSVNLAYVIYTSGSTGRPKGVMIEHCSLTNFLWSMCRQPGLGPDDVMLAMTSLSFDIAALELFGPLLVGARVVLASGGAFLDGREMAAALAASGATVMQATPVSWGLLMDAGWRAERPLVAVCGGEALSGQLASRLLDAGVSLWNLYGPTETTVWSSILRVGPADAHGPSVAIGRPIANTQLYVLDATLQPVPVGVWGELYIGGTGLARGYLGQPELTAQRFVADPYGPDAGRGGRLYRTGDLARYRSDGVVEFGGRVDHQVKLRGYRIEPGEIEAALSRHPDVDRAAVVVDGEGTDKRLVAYVVGGGPRKPPADELRAFLRRSLPPYMVPASFVVLDAFPLTPNGKLDRKALPTVDGERPELAERLVAPRTAVESMVAGIWVDLLRVETVGVHDDFFDLGGNSVLATQVVSRIRDTCGVDLPLRSIFDSPTVAEIARHLDDSLVG